MCRTHRAHRAHRARRTNLSLCLASLGLAAFLPQPIVAASTSDTQDRSANQSVELILDASGSMNAKLPDGTLKIDAAKQAVRQWLGALPGDVELAFRAYGHQSPRSKHDCRDTQLLVDFGPLASVGSQAASRAGALRAQGYTPITQVLELGAKDLAGSRRSEHVIVLVSDGKETCDGDPCATARALRAADAALVIHTVGFGVDAATRSQLECTAAMGGGRYFEAASAHELVERLGTVLQIPGTQPPAESGDGTLEISGANLSGHEVRNAESGEQVAELSSMQRSVKLPAGIYSVAIGPVWWRSVRVEPKKATVLRPGILRVKGAGLGGHEIRDAETGEVHATVSSMGDTVAIMPGTYEVTFAGSLWPGVRVDAGQTVELRPGGLKLEGATINGHAVRDARGTEIGELSSLMSSMPLPPGSYSVETAAGARRFEVAEGQWVTLSAKN